jgi:hypothetical protein
MIRDFCKRIYWALVTAAILCVRPRAACGSGEFVSVDGHLTAAMAAILVPENLR